jgi:hypothetical protein
MNKNSGKEGLIDSINFFVMSMKKRDMNPIGPLLLEYLKDNTESLYNHLIKDDKNEDLVAKKITQDINQHFYKGYNYIEKIHSITGWWISTSFEFRNTPWITHPGLKYQ